MHSDPPFLITTLIFISRIFQMHPGVKTLVTYGETMEENLNEEEHFVDANEISDDNDDNSKKLKSKKKKSNDENIKKVKKNEENKNDLILTMYDPFKRDPLYTHADKTCLWELVCLLNHYHPTVKKYAEMLINNIQNSNNILEYKGNPLLDFNLANFLDRFTFRKSKKKESAGIKSLINKSKLRMSKINDALSIEEVI